MTVSFRKLVKHADLNPAGTLFGGTLLQWVDEAAALYVMCQLETKNVVTVKISESIFKKPVRLGDYLEFVFDVRAFGKSSVIVDCRVETKDLKQGDERQVVFSCEAVFVHVDENGKSKPHGKSVVRVEGEKDVHTEHCCVKHGCKYGKEDCAVERGLKKQSFPCEMCRDSVYGQM